MVDGDWIVDPDMADPSPYASGYVAASDLAGRPIPERQWLIQDMIPGRQVSIIGGDGGTGKSLLGLQLGVAVATGTPWIGRPAPRGRALYVGSEDELAEIHRRLAAICEADSLAFDELDGLTLLPLAGQDATLAEGSFDGLQATPGWRDLVERVQIERPAVLILDTLADLYAANEIARVEVRAFIQMLRGLALDCDAAVILLAHPSRAGMADGSGYSGSTAWNNSVRSRLYLDRVKGEGDEPDPRRRVLRHLKSNYGADSGEIKLTWAEGRYIAEGGIDRMAADAKADRVFLKLLAEFETIGDHVTAAPSGAYAPKLFARHDNSEGVSKREFERAMQRLRHAGTVKLAETSGPNRHKRTVLRRAPTPLAPTAPTPPLSH